MFRHDGLTEDWIPINSKRKIGKPLLRWQDEIDKIAGSDWMVKAQLRDSADDKSGERVKKRGRPQIGEAFIQQWMSCLT